MTYTKQPYYYVLLIDFEDFLNTIGFLGTCGCHPTLPYVDVKGNIEGFSTIKSHCAYPSTLGVF